jgi:hypothetical protein
MQAARHSKLVQHLRSETSLLENIVGKSQSSDICRDDSEQSTSASRFCTHSQLRLKACRALALGFEVDFISIHTQLIPIASAFHSLSLSSPRRCQFQYLLSQ